VRRALRLAFRLAAVGVLIFMLIGAGVGGGFGVSLPDGSRVLFSVRVEIVHAPAEPPAPQVERMQCPSSPDPARP